MTDDAAAPATGLAEAYRRAWSLSAEGPEREDHGVLTQPVRTDAGEPAELRLCPPRSRNEHEHLALRLWAGRGAVRLLRAEPTDRALLLERTGERDLRTLPALESCRVLGELTRTLARPPRPPFLRLSELARQWQADLEQDAGLDARFPRRFRVQAAKNLGRLRREDLDLALVHRDLHQRAVRAAERRPWLAAGADPVLGTPEFALVPGLWHGTEEIAHGGALAVALEDRMEALALAADADPGRLRAWALVRLAVAARNEDPHRGGAPGGRTGRLVQLCKALQNGA